MKKIVVVDIGISNILGLKKILFDERILVKFSQQISFEAHIETPFGKVILK